ncbi:MAG: hypothetical protein U0990_09360 [Candidatus Nanopelagicales bacterium]|nr:hypothetical protein [Candidatus Nanopelagicales bacterium]
MDTVEIRLTLGTEIHTLTLKGELLNFAVSCPPQVDEWAEISRPELGSIWRPGDVVEFNGSLRSVMKQV